MPKVVRATKTYTGSSSDSSVSENEILVIKNSKSKLTGECVCVCVCVCVCMAAVQNLQKPTKYNLQKHVRITHVLGTCTYTSHVAY